MYSAIDFEDPDSEPKDKDGSEDADEDEDADTDREDAALNPSRSNTDSVTLPLNSTQSRTTYVVRSSPLHLPLVLPWASAGPARLSPSTQRIVWSTIGS